MAVTVSRRTFLGTALIPALAPAIAMMGGCVGAQQEQHLFVNGHIDTDGNHFISGFTVDGRASFSQPLPDKAHGFAAHPTTPERIVSAPTLPGTRAVVLNVATGKQQATVHCQPGRHFNGHACFSLDGRFLYTSENISSTAEGVIGVRDGHSFDFIREFSAHGVGPHDIRLLPDGNTLVVAGGGIRTHPDSGKRELNINTMESALLLIDRHSGALIAKKGLSIPRLSFRHMDVGPDGSVLLACQYKGSKHMPKLVGLQRGMGEIEMMDIGDDSLWPLNNYTASARIATNGIAAVACPRGNVLTLWDLEQKKHIKSIAIEDVGGVELGADGLSFLASANIGELYHIDAITLAADKIDGSWSHAKWTNHMTGAFI